MKYRTIEYETKDKVGFLYLNRPVAMNAINQRMEDELVEICDRISDDDRIRALVLAARGDRAFSIGLDLSELKGTSEDGGREEPIAQLRQRILSASAWEDLARLPKPTIAAIGGAALGAGLELALACDIRIAAEGASFGFPEVRHGLIPSHGGTQRLPRIVGRGKAIEMIFSGEAIDAVEAARVELVSRVVPSAELLVVAEEMANRLATYGPIALRYAREAVNRGIDMTFDEGLHLEMDLYALLQTTQDRSEGIRSFKEKRRPKFEGR